MRALLGALLTIGIVAPTLACQLSAPTDDPGDADQPSTTSAATDAPVRPGNADVAAAIAEGSSPEHDTLRPPFTLRDWPHPNRMPAELPMNLAVRIIDNDQRRAADQIDAISSRMQARGLRDAFIRATDALRFTVLPAEAESLRIAGSPAELEREVRRVIQDGGVDGVLLMRFDDVRLGTTAGSDETLRLWVTLWILGSNGERIWSAEARTAATIAEPTPTDVAILAGYLHQAAAERFAESWDRHVAEDPARRLQGADVGSVPRARFNATEPIVPLAGPLSGPETDVAAAGASQ